jgi:hypothetical protein
MLVKEQMPVMSPDRTRMEVADRTDVIGPDQSDLLERAFDAWIARRRKATPVAEKVALRAVWAELVADHPKLERRDEVIALSPADACTLSDLAQSLALMRLTGVNESPAQAQDVATLVPAAARDQEPGGQRAVAAPGNPTPEIKRPRPAQKTVAPDGSRIKQHLTYLDRVMLGVGEAASAPQEQPVTTAPSEVCEPTAPKDDDKPATGKAWGASLRVAAAVALVLVSVGMAQLISGLSSKNDLTAERAALDARAMELTSRATRPGSALACLDGVSGDTVEAFCEKTLFATPEAVTASMSYAAAQLSLLADATDYMRRGGTGYELVISNLRHAAETDRFGIVAHVLSQRDGCTSRQCRAFALFNDTSRVSRNLSEATFERTVGRYTESWPAVAASPPDATVAAKQPLPAASASPSALAAVKPPRRDLFFPSASSIPPINIMVAEPAEARSNAPANTRTPTPPARPQAQ